LATIILFGKGEISGAILVAVADPDPAYKMDKLKDDLAKSETPISIDTYTDSH
jgi:hypothetical protein